MTDATPTQPITLAFVGAGNRAGTYAAWVDANPTLARIGAAAEPDAERRRLFGRKHAITERGLFATLDELLASDMAGGIDALVICTPEGSHHAAAMAAISAGKHVLVEKPLAPTAAECEEIIAESERRGLTAGVCHVLRYHPYFLALREVVHTPGLGRIVSITHRVKVGLDRALHTFVRGPWADAAECSPAILSKCCHDVDILLWLLDEPAQSVTSLGSTSWFTPANAPAGATPRCIDCPLEAGCRYSAVDLYQRRRQWTAQFIGPTPEAAIERHLRNGRYGRCAFACGNTVADRQQLIIATPSGALAALSMDFFTATDGRITSITLTGGEIEADGRSIEVRPFGAAPRVIDLSAAAAAPYHAGADHALIADFVRAVATGIPMASDARSALESHMACLAAERSRAEGTTIKLTD